MKRTRTLSTIFLTLLLSGLMMPSRQVWPQGKKPGPGTQPGPQVSKTKLEVKEFSGDFEQWVNRLTINSPDALTFRWATNETGVASATWIVSDKPLLPGVPIAAAQAPKVIKTGVLTEVPAKGAVRRFDVDFKTILSKTPPATPAHYWVSVVTKDAAQKNIGVASPPIKIVYSKPPPPVEFKEDMGVPKNRIRIPELKLPPKDYKYAISYENIKCLEETADGPGSDEPYAMVWTADFGPGKDKYNPSNSWLFGAYEDVDNGDVRQQSTRVWYPSGGGAQKIADPSKVIILVALMENDLNQDYTVYSESVKEVNFTFTLLVKQGMDRSFVVSRLRDVWADKLDQLTNHPGQLDEDERIGYPQELRITQEDLQLCRKDLQWHFKTLEMSGDGGKYRFTFAIRAEPIY